MNVLVTDGMNKKAVQALIDRGFQVDEEFYEKEELKEAVKNYDAIVVRSKTKIRKDVLDEMKEGGRTKLIIRAGVGVDNIDVDYARKLGLVVRNTPNASTESVAEFAIATIFSLAKRFPEANSSTHDGKWLKKSLKGVEVSGKSLGIIGFGRIGLRTAEKAEAMGMEVSYYDVLPKDSCGFEKKDMDDLLGQSDFVYLTASGAGETLFTKETFSKMKEGSYFINTSRGSYVDQDALADALESGRLKGAAIDVYEKEPLEDERLMKIDSLLLTPHIGGSTEEAQERIGFEVVDIISNFFEVLLNDSSKSFQGMAT